MPTNFTNVIPPNLVVNPQADQAIAPSLDLTRYPQGQSIRPATLSVVPLLQEIAWENRPDSSGVYTDYRITLRVEQDNQVAELPPQEASDTDVYPVEYVNLSKPTLRLIAEWSAERAGQPPENPAKDLGDTNAVYLKGSWNPGGFEIASDGYTFLFQTAGQYEYGFKRPCSARYGAGVPPWAAELMGMPARPFIYNTPNISGIYPCDDAPTAVTNEVSPLLPNVPTREGQTGTNQLTGNLNSTGTSLNGFGDAILQWQNQNGANNLGGFPPGGG